MERILSYPDAILEGILQEMTRDESVIIFGQGVDDPKSIIGTTKGLVELFGPERVFDTPIAEDSMTGMAIGAGLAGIRPIHVHIRMDFLLLAMNQIVNMAAKASYMYGGAVHIPIVIRSLIGKSWGQGPQHSQSLYPFFMNTPGLKVVCPTIPYDAKGLITAAIRDDNPVLFIEHRHLYYQKGHVPKENYALPIGKARIMEQGEDITLVGISQMAIECLRAKRHLEKKGINAEVIDLTSLYPLDMETIFTSVKKTGKIIVVDNAWVRCGAGAEILSQIFENLDTTNIKATRMGFAFVTCPTTPTLEKCFYPNAKTIAQKAYDMLVPNLNRKLSPNELGTCELDFDELDIEENEFKGPF